MEVEDPEPPKRTVLYARVSSYDQKGDLARQIARMSEWAAASGVKVDGIVKEVGSGLNGKRKELGRLLAVSLVGMIVVEHRDRLARFGVGYLERALGGAGRKIMVLDDKEVEDDLVRDMIDLMTCFSARFYGKRSARNRARKAMEALQV